MGKKTKSARGSSVDFDLMKIKSQITSAPKPVDVKAREDFIDRKLRRRVKRAQKKIEEAVVEETTDEAIKVEAPVEAAVVETKEVEETVAPKKKRTIKKKKKKTD